MTRFGLLTFATDYTLPPAEFARWAEDAGFEAIFYAEHTHIPTRRESPFAGGRALPDYYKQSYDPFVALAAAATATERLRLGTGICLVTEHNPITLAKTVATLDQVSEGRVILGIGAGWNAEEMGDHGVAFAERWPVTRERVLAMRQLWTRDEAEYHGKFVDFAPTWSWPKPRQPGGPPVLLGAASRFVPRRVAEYCDGWFPLGEPADLARGVEALRAECVRVGRAFDSLDLTAGTLALLGREPFPTDAELAQLTDAGFTRVVLPFNPRPAAEQREFAPRYEDFLARHAS